MYRMRFGNMNMEGIRRWGREGWVLMNRRLMERRGE